MSPGQSSAGPSAAKLAGVALIGVGALAAVFGAANVLSGEPGGQASGGGPTSSVVAPPQSGAAGAPAPPTTSRPSPPPSKPAPSTPGDRRGQQRPPQGGNTGSGLPGSPRPGGSGGHQQAGQGHDQAAARQQIRMRVYNNSLIEGLAHRAAADFRASGYRVVEIGNYSDGRVPVTTIYYRPGTGEKAQARIVADRFGARLEPRFPGIRDASPGVIAIVTKNYDGPERGGK